MNISISKVRCVQNAKSLIGAKCIKVSQFKTNCSMKYGKMGGIKKSKIKKKIGQKTACTIVSKIGWDQFSQECVFDKNKVYRFVGVLRII